MEVGVLGIGDETTFATGKPDAREIALSIGGGYNFNRGEWTFSPYGRVGYTRGSIDAYTETASHPSAASSMFRIDKQGVDLLTSTIGIRASRVISASNGIFSPYTAVEWKHEFEDRSVTSGTSVYFSGVIFFS